MRNRLVTVYILLVLLAGSDYLSAAIDDRSLVTYHFWLTYKSLPFTSYPVGLPDSKFSLKGYSSVFGGSPLAVFVADTDIDPFCAIRLRTEGFEEINPFKEIMWRPNELQSEYSYSEDKKIKMVMAYASNETALSTVVLSNSGKTPWRQEFVFYSKGNAILIEDYIARKAVTVTSPLKQGFSAMGIYFDKNTVEEVSYVQESGRYRIVARVIVLPESSISYSVGAAYAGDPRSASTAAFSVINKNVYEMITEKEVFYNKLLSNICRIYATDISTRKYYQAVYLLLNGYKKEELADYALRFVIEDRLPKIKERKLWPYVYWRAYEFTGDMSYLETAISNGDNYPKMENIVLDLYNQLVLDWAYSITGKKSLFSRVSLPEGYQLKNEEKVLYMLITGAETKLIEAEAKKLLNYKDLKHPEIFFIMDLLEKADMKSLLPSFYEKELPYTQYSDDRSFSEVMNFMDMYFKSSGLDFIRGNLNLLPLNTYKYRNIYNFKYRGNYLDIVYTKEGKYVDKILLDGNIVNTRLLYLPEADKVPEAPSSLSAQPQAQSATTNSTLSSNPYRKIEIRMSNWPSSPILNSIKTNAQFKVYKCGYDEKTAIFNIDMETPPLETWSAVINISKNSKWIKKVMINWKDIPSNSEIKIEYK